MDQKSWLWKKRSTEKTLVADKATSSLSKNEEEEEEVTEVQKLVTEKTDLERDLRVSNEKLSSALSECNVKDNIVKKQVKIAEEAIVGWEKAESEAISLKQELDKVIQQKVASDERVGHLDAALKECMQQLRFVRDDQEKRTAENAKLIKSLLEKDKVIEELGKFRSRVDAELKALLLRVESTEKENASLKYDARILEKQLDIRSEEREFNRRSAFEKEEELRTLSYRTMGAPDMNLMDDFAEMEKLAVVSVDKKIGSKFSVSVHKVVELLEGINIQSQENGYIVRVFQWKAAELSAILQQFVTICNDLLNGKADIEQFVQQVASNLEWIMNHCFSIQDVSCMKDAIKNHLYWDDSESDDHPMECNKPCIQTDDVPYPGLKEGKIWNVEWGDKESSIPKDIVENLDSEMGKLSDQIEKEKMIKEDLTETNHEWRKACERISYLENELENRSHSCRRLEETCNNLNIQIQSLTSKDVLDDGKEREKQLQSDWEITAASEKLAECQETILNLGKQLKALASPNDAALFDKVIPKTANSAVSTLSTPTKNISRRSSLLNKMIAEDNKPNGSPYTSKENQNGVCYSSASTNAAKENSVKSTSSVMVDHDEKSRTCVASMDIVPRKKNSSRSFFKKLFWPQKGKSGKTPLS